MVWGLGFGCWGFGSFRILEGWGLRFRVGFRRLGFKVVEG